MMRIVFLILFYFYFNNCFSQTNTLPNIGNIGIGTTSPKVLLDVSKSAENNNSETLMKFSVSDAIGQELTVQNYTAINGKFVPLIVSQTNRSDSYSLGLMGVVDDLSLDQGSIPMIRFDARSSSAPLINRPLFSWGSFTNDYMTMLASGNIGIGTTVPKERLSVNGNIRAQQVKVEMENWPDYVFEESYQIPSLKETEAFVKLNKHLPGVPKAKEIEEDGLSLGEMNRILMQKVEELTLHMIRLDKENEELKQQNKLILDLQSDVKKLKEMTNN
jgi:hypothetical protein